MGKLPERKPNRSKEIAARPGPAVCSVGASVARPPLPLPAYPSHPLPMPPLPVYTDTKLSPIGKIIENETAVTQSVRASVIVDCHVIMPNHVHMIIRLNCGGGARAGCGHERAAGWARREKRARQEKRASNARPYGFTVSGF